MSVELPADEKSVTVSREVDAGEHLLERLGGGGVSQLAGDVDACAYPSCRPFLRVFAS